MQDGNTGQVCSRFAEGYSENTSHDNAMLCEVAPSHYLSGNGIFAAPSSILNLQHVQVDQANLPYLFCDAQGMNEVYQDFAARLPGPELLKTLQGRMEGAVKFVRHHNGDISAHQWSNATMSWCHIGQYSCARRRTEGPMSSLQLSGRANEVMAGQENTLAYFVALAHQCQTSICEGYKSNSCIESMPDAGPVHEIDNSNMLEAEMKRLRKYKEIGGYRQPTLSKAGSIVTKENVNGSQYDMPAHTYDNNVLSQVQSYDAVKYQNLDDPFIATSRQQVSCDRQTPQHTFHMFDPNYSMIGRSKTDSKLGNQRDLVELDEASVSPLAQNGSILVKPTIFTQPNKVLFRPLQPNNNASPLVQKLTERCETPGVGAIRTVLYDPLAKAATPDYHQGSSALRPTSAGAVVFTNEVKQVDSAYSNGFFPQHSDIQNFMQSPEDSLFQYKMPDLRQSTPEPGWRDRQVEILTFLTPNMSNEQLGDTHLNTPQKWKGPFFDGSNSPCESIDLANTRPSLSGIHDDARAPTSKFSSSYFDELEYWWSSTKQSGLQAELSKHLRSKSSLVSATADHALDHALLGVFETLSSYVQGSLDQRKSGFSCFGPPPEWCIDRSEKGALTFFGENWGKPPQRLGRDPRYRPLPPQTSVQASAPPIAAGFRRYDAMDGADWRRRHELRGRDIVGW